MRFSSIRILALALLFFAAANAQKTDREKAGLLGAVKTVSSKTTSYLDGNLQSIGQEKQQDAVTYDKVGNEIERVVYDDYGFLVGKEARAFVGFNLVESVLSDPENAVMEKQTYSYEKNRLVQILNFDAKGVVYLKQAYIYDAKGNLSEEIYYVKDKLAGKTVYLYDAKGNNSEVAFFLADGAKAVAPIGPCLGAHRVAYSYNEAGKPSVVTAYEPDGKVKQSWRYGYNAKGNVAEDARESVYSNLKFVYTYEYDSGGNWTKRIASITTTSKLSGDGKPSERKAVTTRAITYY
jgi:hypothetical protein